MPWAMDTLGIDRAINTADFDANFCSIVQHLHLSSEAATWFEMKVFSSDLLYFTFKKQLTDK